MIQPCIIQLSDDTVLVGELERMET